MMDDLFIKVSCPPEESNRKVSLIGVGQVGMAGVTALIAQVNVRLYKIHFAQFFLSQNVSNDIALVDLDENKIEGEKIDFQHGTPFLPNSNTRIKASTGNSFECLVENSFKHTFSRLLCNCWVKIVYYNSRCTSERRRE